MAKKKIVNEGGINGTGEGIVNVNSRDFIAARKMIEETAAAQAEETKIRTEIRSISFQMKDYLADENPPEIRTVGWFLNELIKSVQVKNKDFADYIGTQPSNLSALLNDTRRLNIELALKLSGIFHIDPALWLHIQSKNDLLQMAGKRNSKLQKYSLEDLLELRA
jgi:addiction module HigA family antidote